MRQGRLDPQTALVRARDAVKAEDWPAALVLRGQLLEREDDRTRHRRLSLEHQLACRAPLEVAAHVAQLPGGWFGPLWEVVALRFGWAELGPLLPVGEVRELVAHTRSFVEGPLCDPPEPVALGLPVGAQPWEPALPEGLPRYDQGGCGFGEMADGFRSGEPTTLPEGVAAEPVPALEGLVQSWSTVASARVLGGVREAAGAVAGEGARALPLTPAEALRPLYAAASGSGAYTAWRGLARGRVDALRALAGLAGLPITPTLDPDALGAWLGRCALLGWSERDDDIWFLHLALADPDSGLAWALSAQDFD